MTANSLIFSKLRGHWSLVTCTFTLSLMYSIRFYAEKIGEYENKLQICNAINEIFSHLKLMSPICEDRRHFFRLLSWRVFVSLVGCTSALQIKKLHFFFALRSPCTNFHGVQVRLHLSSPNKKNAFFSLYCVRFALTFTVCKLGCGSEKQIKNLYFFFALRSPCTNFAVQKTKYSEKGLLCEYTFGVYNW